MTYREMLAFIATIDREHLDKEIAVQISDETEDRTRWVTIDDSERDAGAGVGPFLVGSFDD